MPRSSLAVVVNPTKVDDLSEVKQVVSQACRRHGWAEPTWVETTAEETGEQQARAAVAEGADLVASLGGDGTVRAVASALVGTDTALGLLPGGTGNLLARNLGLPVDSLEEAVEAMLAGHDRRIDVGRVATDGTDANGGEVFLVMAGLGLDGEIMAGTNETMKKVVGWPAYVVEGVKGLFRDGFRVAVESDADRVSRHARIVLVGNCGTLQGGIELLPDAEVDDGVLDVVVLAPNGLLGWMSVAADVATRHRAGHQRLQRLRVQKVTIRTSRPVPAEADGDPLGDHRHLTVTLEPRALVVRCA